MARTAENHLQVASLYTPAPTLFSRTTRQVLAMAQAPPAVASPLKSSQDSAALASFAAALVQGLGDWKVVGIGNDADHFVDVGMFYVGGLFGVAHGGSMIVVAGSV